MESIQSALAFWSQYLATLDDPEIAQACFYETFSIGNTPASASNGAQLILAGHKTATSALLWEYEADGRRPPGVGALSILEAGLGLPAAVIETTEVRTLPFQAIDPAFAADYGEFGGQLESWRAACWDIYRDLAARLGRTPSLEMPLVCERFKVVYRG